MSNQSSHLSLTQQDSAIASKSIWFDDSTNQIEIPIDRIIDNIKNNTLIYLNLTNQILNSNETKQLTKEIVNNTSLIYLNIQIDNISNKNKLIERIGQTSLCYLSINGEYIQNYKLNQNRYNQILCLKEIINLKTITSLKNLNPMSFLDFNCTYTTNSSNEIINFINEIKPDTLLKDKNTDQKIRDYLNHKPLIHLATIFRAPEAITILISHSVSIGRCVSIDCVDKQGFTPFQLAATLGDNDLVEFFLKNNAELISVEESPRGLIPSLQSALYRALSNPEINLPTIRLLLNKWKQHTEFPTHIKEGFHLQILKATVEATTLSVIDQVFTFFEEEADWQSARSHFSLECELLRSLTKRLNLHQGQTIVSSTSSSPSSSSNQETHSEVLSDSDTFSNIMNQYLNLKAKFDALYMQYFIFQNNLIMQKHISNSSSSSSSSSSTSTIEDLGEGAITFTEVTNRLAISGKDLSTLPSISENTDIIQSFIETYQQCDETVLKLLKSVETLSFAALNSDQNDHAILLTCLNTALNMSKNGDSAKYRLLLEQREYLIQQQKIAARKELFRLLDEEEIPLEQLDLQSFVQASVPGEPIEQVEAIRTLPISTRFRKICQNADLRVYIESHLLLKKVIEKQRLDLLITLIRFGVDPSILKSEELLRLAFESENSAMLKYIISNLLNADGLGEICQFNFGKILFQSKEIQELKKITESYNKKIQLIKRQQRLTKKTIQSQNKQLSLNIDEIHLQKIAIQKIEDAVGIDLINKTDVLFNSVNGAYFAEFDRCFRTTLAHELASLALARTNWLSGTNSTSTTFINYVAQGAGAAASAHGISGGSLICQIAGAIIAQGPKMLQSSYLDQVKSLFPDITASDKFCGLLSYQFMDILRDQLVLIDKYDPITHFQIDKDAMQKLATILSYQVVLFLFSNSPTLNEKDKHRFFRSTKLAEETARNIALSIIWFEPSSLLGIEYYQKIPFFRDTITYIETLESLSRYGKIPQYENALKIFLRGLFSGHFKTKDFKGTQKKLTAQGFFRRAPIKCGTNYFKPKSRSISPNKYPPLCITDWDYAVINLQRQDAEGKYLEVCPNIDMRLTRSHRELYELYVQTQNQAEDPDQSADSSSSTAVSSSSSPSSFSTSSTTLSLSPSMATSIYIDRMESLIRKMQDEMTYLKETNNQLKKLEVDSVRQKILLTHLWMNKNRDSYDAVATAFQERISNLANLGIEQAVVDSLTTEFERQIKAYHDHLSTSSQEEND